MEPKKEGHNRAEHIAKRLEKDRLARITSNACPECNLYLKWCICNSIPKIQGNHSCSVILNYLEVNRSTSTHKILQLCLGSDVYVNDYSGDITTIWEKINDKCRKTGQRPVILFPSPTAVSPTELYNSMTPTERKAGLHVVAIDGSWNEARSIIRGIQNQLVGSRGIEDTSVTKVILEPTFCVVQPTVPHTLFQPLRKQPHPNRISTVEAVACVFDEWYNVSNDAYEMAKIDSNSQCDPKLTVNEHVATSHIEKMDNPEDTGNNLQAKNCYIHIQGTNLEERDRVESEQFQYLDMPHVHDVLIPSFPSYQSRQLRYALCILVDRVCRQSGLISPNARGSGYRTWKLNEETCGYFGKIPTWIVEKIAVAAYGRNMVVESGYHVRTAKFTKHWESLGVAAGPHGTKHSHNSISEDAKDEVQKSPLEWKYNLRLCQGGLPRPNPPFTATPLALCNSEIYCLFAGMWKI